MYANAKLDALVASCTKVDPNRTLMLVAGRLMGAIDAAMAKDRAPLAPLGDLGDLVHIMGVPAALAPLGDLGPLAPMPPPPIMAPPAGITVCLPARATDLFAAYDARHGL